ncbi:MAG: AAA family ATPase [Deltaproteobacteria bacterium]|nr:AAA family ATPase [Deltaproteobacteria bacterium]MBW2120404.1 AAA family ATPase [Deltaproteobacteria bacterium]
MSFTVAVSGKGGTGKTTIAGFLIQYLLDRGKKPVLAVDADANTNLNEVLGVEVKATIGEARDLMKKDVPVGMTKDIWFEYKIQEALVEKNGFDLIAMGRPEGPGCYCAANTLARKCIDILAGNYPYVVIDNEAGMEHFSRMTTRNVDLLLIVSDPSARGVLTGARIRDLIRELNLEVGRAFLLLNRVENGPQPEIVSQADKLSLPVAGVIPADPVVYQYDLEGRPTSTLPRDSVALRASWEIFDKLIP